MATGSDEEEGDDGPAIGGLAMELRDLWLELRTRVLASEKAVSQRWGASVTGWATAGETTGSSLVGEVTGGAEEEEAEVEAAAEVSGTACCRLFASRACCQGLVDGVLVRLSSLVADEPLLVPLLRGGVASDETVWLS